MRICHGCGKTTTQIFGMCDECQYQIELKRLQNIKEEKNKRKKYVQEKLIPLISKNQPIITNKIPSFSLDTLTINTIQQFDPDRPITDVIRTLILKALGKDECVCFVCNKEILTDFVQHHLDYTRTTILHDGLSVPVHQKCHSKAWQINTRSEMADKVYCHSCHCELNDVSDECFECSLDNRFVLFMKLVDRPLLEVYSRY